MRLKSIKLAGFKSFVEPTTIPFRSNLTAIVGPNGCGKSNVIDAVRWVLGESSARNLRGEAMTDVIFNGSGRRQPVHQCSVELVFDNSAQTLRGPYAEYLELSVRRKVTRDGQSTYFLNGTKCRRRDITDLFAGTGMGPRSYAIIEQGMISRLIEARPEELRVYIEEAAGITKYKDRRRETETRMRRTQDNLNRLNDVRDELTRQLAHLQRQAKAAETYRTLKAEEKQARAELLVARWRELGAESVEQQQAVALAERDLDAQIAVLRSCENQIEHLRDNHQQANEAFHTAQQAYYETGAQISQLEQKLTYQRQQAQKLAEDQRLLEREREALVQHEQQDREQLRAVQDALAEQEPQWEQAQQEQALAQAVVAEQEAAFATAEEQWQQYSLGSAEAARTAERWRTRGEQARQVIAQAQQRRTRIQSELTQWQQHPAAQELLQLQHQRDEAEQAEAAVAERAQDTEHRLQQEREQQQQRQQRLTDLRQQLAREQQEIASLKASLQAVSGDGEAVQHWLTHWQLQRSPQVLSLLRAEPPWQQVAEWVLGHWLQSHVLPASRLTQTLWEQLPELRVSWLTDAAPEVPVQPGTLAEVIEAPAALRPLLNQIYRASTRTEAQQRLATLAPEASVISADGFWFGQGWVRVFRSAEDHAGLLQQKDRLAQLQLQVDETEFELEDAQLNHEAAQISLEALTQDWQHQRSQHEQARQHLHALETKISALSATQQQMAQSMQRAEQDLAEIDQEITAARATIAEADSALAEQPDPTADPAGDALQQARDESRMRLADARATLREQEAELQRLLLAVNSLRQQETALRAALARSAEQQAQWQAREQSIQTLATEPADDVSEQLEHWVGQQLEQQAALDDARAAVEQFHEQMRTLDQQRLAAEQESRTLQQHLQEQQLAQERVRVRQTTIEEQLREQQFDLASLQAQLPEALSVATCEQQIEQLLQRIQRLGPINLAAIDEYEVQQQRQTYLAAQYADLEEALQTLQAAIRRIDQETRQRFKTTFDLINGGLQALFPKVFGGGHAYLAMTGEDLLNTGVTIMARPPGKRNATIHLLSGGEKALTAIALVFSIFRLNPAPFCLLDEVDAPLDDANVMRFARLVETMSEQVEFVYITHNKVAMEMAHQLMGVTMTEPGVSRLVAVNVEEALEMSES